MMPPRFLRSTPPAADAACRFAPSDSHFAPTLPPTLFAFRYCRRRSFFFFRHFFAMPFPAITSPRHRCRQLNIADAAAACH